MQRIIHCFVALMPALVLAVPISAQEVTEDEGYQIAKDAYVYAYPLLLTHVTWQQFSNYAEPTGVVGQAPLTGIPQSQTFCADAIKGPLSDASARPGNSSVFRHAVQSAGYPYVLGESGLGLPERVKRPEIDDRIRTFCDSSLNPVDPTAFPERPFGEHVEGLLSLISRLFSHVEPSSICSDLA
jgi:hypothetical protein